MTVASALPAGRAPADAQASLSVPVDSAAVLPSAILIETAGVRGTVAAEHSVSGSQEPGRLPGVADGFTKGWIGVPPQRKERREQPRKPMTVTTMPLKPSSSNLNWKKRPCRAEREPCAPKNRREALDTDGSFRDGDTILVLT